MYTYATNIHLQDIYISVVSPVNFPPRLEKRSPARTWRSLGETNEWRERLGIFNHYICTRTYIYIHISISLSLSIYIYAHDVFIDIFSVKNIYI